MHVSTSLLELLPRGGGAFFPAQALRQVQGAVAGHATGGGKAGGAFWVAQSVTFWGEKKQLKWEEYSMNLYLSSSVQPQNKGVKRQ